MRSYAARGSLLFSAATYARTPLAAGDAGPVGPPHAATSDSTQTARRCTSATLARRWLDIQPRRRGRHPIHVTTPYRELYVEPAAPRAFTAFGHCPWCRARVEWRRGVRRAVCGACGARYATAQALVATEEPAPPTERAALWRRPREKD